MRTVLNELAQALSVGPFLLAVACGRVDFVARPDSTGTPRHCTEADTFRDKQPITELNDVGFSSGTFRLAADELSGYYWSNRSGKSKVYYAHRDALDGVFTSQLVPGLSAAADEELDPMLAEDGSFLIYRHRVDPMDDDIYTAPAMGGPTEFGPAAAVPILNSSAREGQTLSSRRRWRRADLSVGDQRVR